MNIDNECVSCIINQAHRVATAINASDTLSAKMVANTTKMSKKFSFNSSPPVIASDVYEQLALLANKSDLYDEVKKESTKKAISFVPKLQNYLNQSDNLLYDATKVAIAGNVIDLAAQVSYDLDLELEHIFHTNFAIDDFEKLKKKLEHSKTLVYLGDNVGEHIFDKLYIETLSKLFLNLDIYYFTRGTPIINDVTYSEAIEAGIDSTCSVIDSGVNTPGFDYERASLRAKTLFDEADVVISKGMGNYECMSEYTKDNIFFLLKVKCSVVATSLNSSLGDIICKKI